MSATVAARLVTPIVTTFALPSKDVAQILCRFDISQSDLFAPGARVPHDALLELLALAEATTGDESLGLHGAMVHGPKLHHVVDYIGRASRTFGDALEKFGRYHRLLHDGLSLRVERGVEQSSIELGLDHGLRFPRVFAEYAMASLRIAGQTMGLHGGTEERDWHAVYFAHAEPRDASELRRFFRVPLHFGASSTRVVFRTDLLDREPVEADPVLCALLEHHADQLLKRLPKAKPLVERVRRLIAAELRGGQPSEARVAEQLDMHPRTLRRRLRRDGTHFQELLDELRRDYALSYLRGDDFDIDDTAFLLGFSDASAFRRAVRRWTGRTVPELRLEVRGAPETPWTARQKDPARAKPEGVTERESWS